MTLRAGAAVAYLALLGSLATGLYDPLVHGVNRWWLVAGMLVAASVALGAIVRRRWALLVPAIPCAAVAALAAVRADGPNAIVVGGVVLPALVAAVGAGWAGTRLRRLARPLTAIALAATSLPLALAAVETVARAGAPVLSAAEQARLPVGSTLANLCPGGETPGAERRALRGRADRLVAEVRRRPGALVERRPSSSHGADGGVDRLTVTELAEEELARLEDGGCAPDVQGRLRRALDAA